jgi:lipid II:glycine glycyltransferase (peptidoglycan interpeptide bridge formation enzyme)
MNKLDLSYNIGFLSAESWNKIVYQFSDASIYQTWEYGNHFYGSENLIHVVGSKGSDLLFAAQAVNYKIPIFNTGLAYIANGPLINHKFNQNPDKDFTSIFNLLKKSFFSIKIPYLRIKPPVLNTKQNHSYINSLTKNNFNHISNIPNYRSLFVDLTKDETLLYESTTKKWRENYRRALRSGLRIKRGKSIELFQIFIKIYKEMRLRKNFYDQIDIMKYLNLQRDLPESFKMDVMVAEKDNTPVAGIVWTAIGNTGIPLFSATAQDGLKVRGSYLLRWEMLKIMKNEQNCSLLDQGGINPQNNPGGYKFKSGMGGDDSYFIGNYSTSTIPIIRVFVDKVSISKKIITSYRSKYFNPTKR